MRVTTSGANPENWFVSITRSARRSLSDERTDAFADSPKIATITTSARPITSALAVAAVRRGFRIAFPRAIAPVTPVAARTGSPSAPASGRANVASSTITPKNTSRAPTPTTRNDERTSSALCDWAMPTRSTGTPAAISAPPARVRRRNVSVRSAGRSLIAATGGMVAARNAGHTEAPTVTNMPTAIAATAVRVSNTRSPCGASKPSAPTTENRSPASSTPSARPATDATLPMTPASMTTDTMICASAGAHRPQQAELVGSLGDEDRERVEDDERGDDETDGGEPEQHTGEEIEELGDVFPRVGRDLIGGRHLERPPERAGDVPTELGRGSPRARRSRTPRRAAPARP